MAAKTTHRYKGHTFEVQQHRDSVSVLCTDPSIVDGIDQTDWPSDVQISAWAGLTVRGGDAGDSPDGVEWLATIAGGHTRPVERLVCGGHTMSALNRHKAYLAGVIAARAVQRGEDAHKHTFADSPWAACPDALALHTEWSRGFYDVFDAKEGGTK